MVKGFINAFKSEWGKVGPITEQLRLRWKEDGVATPVESSQKTGLLNLIASSLSQDPHIQYPGTTATAFHSLDAIKTAARNAVYIATNPTAVGSAENWVAPDSSWSLPHGTDLKAWLGSLAALCLASLQEQWKDIRNPPSEAELLRLAWLWEALSPPGQVRWIPDSASVVPSGGRPLAVHLLKEIERLQPRSYDVLFSTVLTDESDGCVLKARLFLFETPQASTDQHLGEFFRSLPNVHQISRQNPASLSLLAPWSIVSVDQESLYGLADGLIASEQLGADQHILIEVAPVAGSRLLAPNVVGESLGVAVYLSLLAARESQNLYRIAATGRLQGKGILGVLGVRKKVDVLCNDLKDVRDLRILIPKPNWGEIKREQHDRVKENFRDGGICPLPGTVVELGGLKSELLTDGLGDYRKSLQASSANWKLPTSASGEDKAGVYFDCDMEPLGAAVAAIHKDDHGFAFQQAGRQTKCFSASIPFDNDPVPAVKHLLQALYRELKNPDKPGDLTPIPCALSSADKVDEWTTAAGLLTQCIQRALSDLGLTTPEGKLAIQEDVLQRLLRGRDWSKLLLVVYAPRSTRIDYPADRERLELLSAACVERSKADLQHQPTILLLSSDVHHELFVAKCCEGLEFLLAPMAATH